MLDVTRLKLPKGSFVSEIWTETLKEGENAYKVFTLMMESWCPRLLTTLSGCLGQVSCKPEDVIRPIVTKHPWHSYLHGKYPSVNQYGDLIPHIHMLTSANVSSETMLQVLSDCQDGDNFRQSLQNADALHDISWDKSKFIRQWITQRGTVPEECSDSVKVLFNGVIENPPDSILKNNLCVTSDDVYRAETANTVKLILLAFMMIMLIYMAYSCCKPRSASRDQARKTK